VSDRLLVSPVIVGRGEAPQRVKEWLVPALLRLAVSGSRRGNAAFAEDKPANPRFQWKTL
jgi:hypothetical protein